MNGTAKADNQEIKELQSLQADSVLTSEPASAENITYKIDKKLFIISPKYHKGTDRTINNVLFYLMLKDNENI